MRMCVQLGGKGANLCEMARIGLNVPAGLTITTEVCRQYSTGTSHRIDAQGLF